MTVASLSGVMMMVMMMRPIIRSVMIMTVVQGLGVMMMMKT